MSERLPLARAFAESRPQAAARALEEMPSSDAAVFLEALSGETAAAVVEHMSPGAAARRLSAMDLEKAGACLTELDSRAGGAVLRACAPDARHRLLNQLPARRVRHFRRSLAYTLDVVGAWIEYGVPALSAQQTCTDALSLLRNRNRTRDTQVFLYGSGRRYVGTVSVGSLLQAKPNTELARLSVPVRPVPDGLDIDEVEGLPEWDERVLLPVTAPDGSLLGGLSRSGLNRALRSVFPDLPQAEPESLLAHLLAAYLRTGSELIRLLIGRSATTGPSDGRG